MIPKKEGILLVDKEKGRTAFYYVKVLRKLSGIRKVGHAGTLDPLATGVMVLLIGSCYTKLSDTLIANDKEYEGEITLGSATTTFDAEGETTHQSSVQPSLEAVEEAIAHFQGTLPQIPPMFSAKKVGGKKLLHLARKGIEVERKPVLIHLKTTLLSYTYPHLHLRISCSKGTYIRSIADEIGKRLKSFGHLSALKRIRSGAFTLDRCIDGSKLLTPSFCYTPYLRKVL